MATGISLAVNQKLLIDIIPAASLLVTIIVLEVIAVTSTFFFLLFLPDHALIPLLDVGKRRQPKSSLTELTQQHSGVSQMTL